MIFLSQSGRNIAEAIALRDWLFRHGHEVFLDLDPQRGIQAGELWQEALKNAAERAELVIFVISPEWVDSKWALTEFSLANKLNKRIVGVIVEPTLFVPTGNYEWLVDLTAGTRDYLSSVTLPPGDKTVTVAFAKQALDRLYIRLMEVVTRIGITAEKGPVEDAKPTAEAAPPAERTREQTTVMISYRREDTDLVVGRICDRLRDHYGAERVMMDIDSIPYGLDFREQIREALNRCDIMLAIIGPRWLALNEKGESRLANEADWVRIEIEAALAKDIPLIPVLIDGARPPKQQDLPEEMQNLAFRQATEVDMRRDFHAHMDRLIRVMDRLLATR